MDGRDPSGLRSYFNDHHHHHQLVDRTTSSLIAGKGIFSAPSSAAGDANPFAIPQTVIARPSQARPSAIATAAAESAKRKRGRPRKYGALPSIPTLSLPTSAMSGSANASTSRLSPSSSSRKKEASKSSSKKFQLAALGNAGQGFTPHVIAVSAGEDLVNKLVSMMERWKRAVCILSATGSILNPSLRHPASSGSYVTYEGMFEIISLFGTLLYTKADGTSSRTCGLGICLSGIDGHVVGGGIEGPLMAAGPVQVIAGSFLININTDFSASKVDGFTNKVSTEAANTAKLAPPIDMESTLGSSSRMSSSARSDEHQSMGGGYHLFHSRPLFLSPEWEGRRISGPTGTSQTADDEDDEYFGD